MSSLLHDGFQLLLFIAHAACVGIDAFELGYRIHPNIGMLPPGSSLVHLVLSLTPFEPSLKPFL